MAHAVIRDRWQMTLPDEVRVFEWLRMGAVVEFEPEEEKLVMRPYRSKSAVDWKEIWRGIKLCRSFKPKKRSEKSASEFILEDRYRH